MKFFQAVNNGVIAIVTETVYQKMEERFRLIQECEKIGLPTPQLPPIGPVFTFSQPDHPSFKFMTGSISLLKRLVDKNEVVAGTIWVPFSNHSEWGDEPGRSFEIMQETSLDQAIEAFGLKI